MDGWLQVFQETGWYGVLGIPSGPVVSGVSRDWMVWCFEGVSVDRWLQVLQGTGWYGMVFWGCFSGPVVTGVSRDWMLLM